MTYIDDLNNETSIKKFNSSDTLFQEINLEIDNCNNSFSIVPKNSDNLDNVDNVDNVENLDNIENVDDNYFLDIDGEIWDINEKYAFFIVTINFFIACLFSLIGYINKIPEITLKIDLNWFYNLIKILLSIFLFLLGLIKYNYREVPVQYLRKTFHILCLLILPYVSYRNYILRKNESEKNKMNLLTYNYYLCIWSSFYINLGILLLSKPIRKIDNFIGYFSRIAFLSINRDEDRPFTILWFILQISAVTLIETPMTLWFAKIDKFHLFWIPVFASGLGDGLAEIVGKRWGKNKYKVYALFTDRIYERSLEGSFCVYFFTLIGIFIGYNYYTIIQLTITLLFLPILTTLMEAFSPHTWDNHFIFGIIWLFLWIIFTYL